MKLKNPGKVTLGTLAGGTGLAGTIYTIVDLSKVEPNEEEQKLKVETENLLKQLEEEKQRHKGLDERSKKLIEYLTEELESAKSLNTALKDFLKQNDEEIKQLEQQIEMLDETIDEFSEEITDLKNKLNIYRLNNPLWSKNCHINSRTTDQQKGIQCYGDTAIWLESPDGTFTKWNLQIWPTEIGKSASEAVIQKLEQKQ